MSRKTYWLLGAAIIAIVLAPHVVQAKSAYLVGNHSTRAFQAWDINPDGTVTYQYQTSLSTTTDPAGIGLYEKPGDPSFARMYISGEFTPGGGLEIWNPITQTHVGHNYNGGEVSGVTVDTGGLKVYAVSRQSNRMHTWDIAPSTGDLTYVGSQVLGGLGGTFSIALDEVRDTMWVADYNANSVRAYSTSDFSTPVSSFTPAAGHTPTDITVDTIRNVVYTTGGWANDYTLSAYDVASGTEKQFDFRNVPASPDHGLNVIRALGVAVDEVTGYLYVTTGGSQGAGFHEILVMDPSKNPANVGDWLVQEIFRNTAGTDVIGSPAGIVIGNVSYNPLDLQKTGPASAQIGSLFGFDISLMPGTIDYTNCVLTDALAPEMSFISATLGGVYDAIAHTVTWDLADILAGGPSQLFELLVGWNNGAVGGNIYTNYATITSDQIQITRTAGVEATQQGPPIIPEPLTMLCVGMAVVGLGGYIRKRRVA